MEKCYKCRSDVIAIVSSPWGVMHKCLKCGAASTHGAINSTARLHEDLARETHKRVTAEAEVSRLTAEVEKQKAALAEAIREIGKYATEAGSLSAEVERLKEGERAADAEIERLKAENAKVRAELAALKPVWSKEVPTKEGAYLIRWPGSNEVKLVTFVRDRFLNEELVAHRHGTSFGMGVYKGHQFAGPLPEPEE